MKKVFLIIGLVVGLALIAALTIIDKDTRTEILAELGFASAQADLGKLYFSGDNPKFPLDFHKGFQWYIKAAEKGHVDAQYNLGVMYSGQDIMLATLIRPNYDEALKWLSKAAEQGHADAQTQLGEMYFHGRGTEKNYSQAAKWYEKSAKQGDSRVQVKLGIMYVQGQGVRQDNSKAKEWFGKACDNGLQLGCDAYRELN